MKKGDKVLAISGPAVAAVVGVKADFLVVHDTAHPDLVVVAGPDGPLDGLWRQADFVPYWEAGAPGPAALPEPQTEHARRKARPLARGLAYYFPDALRAVAGGVLQPGGQSLFPVQLTSLIVDGFHEAAAILVLSELQQHLTGRRPVLGSDMWGTFREALQEVAAVSVVGNEQHHPGAPLHWEKDKSRDHTDCLLRHWADHMAGCPVDSDGLWHLAKSAWRVLAWFQAHLERQNPGLARVRGELRAALAAGTEL